MCYNESMKPSTCALCGTVKESKHTLTYCSRSCARKAAHIKAGHVAKTRDCAHCREPFSTYRDNQLFCSKGCATGFRNAAKRVLKTCEFCSTPFHPRLSRRRFCSKSCGAKARKGNNAYNWNGGFYITTQGYKAITLPDGSHILEHRRVMEQQLGRPLEARELVHHKNEDKLDNRIENLELTTRPGHRAYHATYRSETEKQCAMCEQIKPRAEFHPRKSARNRDPHRCRCKTCEKKST